MLIFIAIMDLCKQTSSLKLEKQMVKHFAKYCPILGKIRGYPEVL